MLDRLNRAAFENVTQPVVGSLVDMTVGLGDVGQLPKPPEMAKGGPVKGYANGGEVSEPKNLREIPDVTLGYLVRKYGPAAAADMLDELGELRGAFNAGLETQVRPDEGGLPGLALSAGDLLNLPPLLMQLAGAGAAYAADDPELIDRGLKVAELGERYGAAMPEAIRNTGARYDRHLNNMLAKYGLLDSASLDPIDRFALAAGEMAGQLPLPANAVRKVARLLQGAPKAISKGVPLTLEYFGPTVDPKLANYAAGTVIGGGVRQFDGTDEPENEPLEYSPPPFPRMAEGGPVYDPARIEAMVDDLMAPKMAEGGPVKFGRGGGVADKTKALVERAKQAATRQADEATGGLTDAERAFIAGAVEDTLPSSGLILPEQTYGRSTIKGAGRKVFPGIFEDPNVLVRNASAQIAPESDALKRLFGVTREDLYDMAMAREPTIWLPPGAPTNSRGTGYAAPIMYPANTQRLQDTLAEGLNSPLRPGMIGWYMMDPAYNRLLELVGPDEAANMFRDFNTLTGIHSAQSDVATELTRGSAMNWLNRQGRLADYIKYAKKMGIRGTPEDMARVPGHMGHTTSHLKPALRYLDTGALSDAAKTPAYITASMPVELGTQNNFPVGDAHYSRAIGLPDVRSDRYNRKTGLYDPNIASWSMPEAIQLSKWWADKVAGPVGLQAVPGQALLWGIQAPVTGVESLIGAPKLEILADLIMKTAARLNVSPETARDMVLMGKAYAGYADGGVVSYLQHLARK